MKTNDERYQSTADLPGMLPIFPLPGALLLPGGDLPLNIFEPSTCKWSLPPFPATGSLA